jgi:hypothetical protein
MDAITSYAVGASASTEVKASLGLDRWGLLQRLASEGCQAPRMDSGQAARDAAAVLFRAQPETPSLVLADASPLIHLARAGCLHVLPKLRARFFLADETAHEACHQWRANAGHGPWLPNTPIGAVAIEELLCCHRQQFTVVPTDLGAMLARQRQEGQATLLNASELAGPGLLKRQDLFGSELRVWLGDDADCPPGPVCQLASNERLPVNQLFALSTFGLLTALEQAGLIGSALRAHERVTGDGC